MVAAFSRFHRTAADSNHAAVAAITATTYPRSITITPAVSATLRQFHYAAGNGDDAAITTITTSYACAITDGDSRKLHYPRANGDLAAVAAVTSAYTCAMTTANGLFY
jgi:hypothetical protein